MIRSGLDLRNSYLNRSAGVIMKVEEIIEGSLKTRTLAGTILPEEED